MDVAFCVNDAYVKYVAVTVCSLFENNRGCNDIHIHILTDGLSVDNNRLIGDTVNKYGGVCSIHVVDDTSLSRLKSTWSIYAWYRLLIPDLLPNVHTCLYLDADIIVSGSISELFDMVEDNVSLYAVRDIEDYFGNVFDRLGYPVEKGYICSGVLLMNLDYWRAHNLKSQIIDYTLKNSDIILYPDQDAINVVCQDTKRFLPFKYGVSNAFMRFEPFVKNNVEQIEDMVCDSRIIHYAGLAPWIIEKNRHFFRDQWFIYNRKLGDIVQSEHIYSGMTMFKYRIKRILTRLGLMNYTPYFTKPALSIDDVMKLIEKYK